MTKYTPEEFNKFGVGALPGLIGIDFTSVTPELLQARTPVRPELLAPNGYLH
ncbi:MAG: 1,4-dihydroxy-2-naphthoyl-CoA hydrolase, partial [Kribbellaceae bacterium]|nr:1,4-dihydroxy-2-naphthoyl-CoA hydrolase [Kribbellaceae bacterium]